MYVLMYICLYVCMHACMYVSIYVCMYVYMYVRSFVCRYLYMYVCMYVCLYVCMYVKLGQQNLYIQAQKSKYKNSVAIIFHIFFSASKYNFVICYSARMHVLAIDLLSWQAYEMCI